jgi:2-haloalkanoic acid dehalogenase type II
MIDFSSISAMTFDCYGTLIDWETGITRALAPLLASRSGRSVNEQELLEAYAAAEAQAEAGAYQPYRRILATVTLDLASRFHANLQSGDEGQLAASVACWPAFPDTPAALSRLATRFRLIITSNIDRDLFAATRPRLGSAPLELISAEEVRSYKPGPAHFQAALKLTGLAPARICHVAQSLYHDIGIARSLGFRTVWVNRRRSKSGAGATLPAAATPDLEVPDLLTLAQVAAPPGH